MLNVAARPAQLARRHLDRSADLAMRQVFAGTGVVSGTAMQRAILSAISDLDGQAAGRELRTIFAFVKAHSGRLSSSSREVVRAYFKVAHAARASGRTGLNPAEVRSARQAMSDAASAPRGTPRSDEVRPSQRTQPAGSARPTPASNSTSASPSGSGSRSGWQARALAQPNDFFKRQGFSKRFNNFFRDHPDRARDLSRNGNCNPTSLAMALKAFGLETPGMTAQQSIDRARRAMTGNIEDDIATNATQLQRGARSLGLQSQLIRPGQGNSFDQQLDSGRMVVLHGLAASEYTRGIRRTDPSYSLRPILHAILVMGKTGDGRYVVADPLSRKGVAYLTRTEIASYWRGVSAKSIAVWR